jgi:hypothetical protein
MVSPIAAWQLMHELQHQWAFAAPLRVKDCCKLAQRPHTGCVLHMEQYEC